MVSQRRFGVELECGNPTLTYGEVRTRAEQAKIPHLSVGYDGSGVEFRTKPLKGAKGIQTLRESIEWLLAQGCFVSQQDGMHVHHEAKELVKEPELIPLLAQSWLINEKTIESMVAHRRRGAYICSRFGKNHLDSVKKSVKDKDHLDVPRGALNLNALRAHSTIEIRLHEGCLNADQAIAWVRFGQAFVDEVVRHERPLGKYQSCTTMLRTLDIEDEHAKQLLTKTKDDAFVDGYNPWYLQVNAR